MLNKYSKDSDPIDEIIHQIKMIRNPNKTPLKATVAEREKLRRQREDRQKKLKNKNRNKNLNSKQSFN